MPMPSAKDRSITGSRSSITCIRLVAGAACVFFLLPRTLYLPPAAGLDGSWVVALHRAFAEGLVFGRDLLFTFGPLGVLATRLPEPGMTPLYLAFDVFLILNIVALVGEALRRPHPGAVVAALALSFIHSGALYFLDPPAFLFLFSFSWFIRFTRAPSEIAFGLSLGCAAMAFFLKPHYGLIALILLFVAAALAASEERTIRAVARPLLAGVTIWALSALLNVELAGYLRASLGFATHYSDAMSTVTKEHEWLVLWGAPLLAGTLLLALVESIDALRRPLALRSRLDGALHAAWYAFGAVLLWKQAVVRADAHAWIFLELLPPLLAVSVVHLVDASRRIHLLRVALFAISLLVLAIATPERLGPGAIRRKLSQTAHYLVELGGDSPSFVPPPPVFGPPPHEMLMLVGDETVDVMPWELSILGATSLRYAPRGVMQSYAAYDGYLDGTTAAILQSERAPHFLLMHAGCIDRRFCAFDEPASRLAILERYRVVRSSESWLLLEHGEARPYSSRPVREGRLRLGERLELPRSSSMLALKTDIDYSLLGRARRILLRPAELEVVVERASGKKRSFRAILPLLQSGVPVNLWLEELEDSRRFFERRFDELDEIVSIELDSKERDDFMKEFSYALVELTENHHAAP